MTEPFRRIVIALALGTLAVAAVVVLMRQAPAPPAASTGSAPLTGFLSSDSAAGFEAVTPGRTFRFPEDHGAHPGYRQEWWYFTGNLATADGRRLGYQLTFFRFAQAVYEELEHTGWNAGQAWMAHFAVSDIQRDRFYSDQDFARQAAGLAGARAAPFRVWVNDWSVTAAANGCGGCFTARIEARSDAAALSLTLETDRPPVLQGDNGYSDKNAEGSVASYYYSMPRLETTGHIEVGGERLAVTGTTWMDREWSTAALAGDQTGWDWFALHFDDGRALMLYQVRNEDGRHHRYGSLVGADGIAETLTGERIVLEPRDYWTSPHTGARYPLRWQVRIDGETGMAFDVEPLMADQEMDLMVRYWEGAVTIVGSDSGRPLNGIGYMELTGYGDR